jgi:hypothetical protein
VPIDSGSGLGAEVAVPGVEIECTDAVFAADTLELYSPFDPIGGVVSHGLIVVRCSEGRTAPRWAVEGNLWSPLCEHEPITLRDVRVASDNIICPPPEIARCGCMTRRFVLHADQSERVPRHD